MSVCPSVCLSVCLSECVCFMYACMYVQGITVHAPSLLSSVRRASCIGLLAPHRFRLSLESFGMPVRRGSMQSLAVTSQVIIKFLQVMQKHGYLAARTLLVAEEVTLRSRGHVILFRLRESLILGSGTQQYPEPWRPGLTESGPARVFLNGRNATTEAQQRSNMAACLPDTPMSTSPAP